MKVIFLDIDGVLNTSETFIERRKNYERTGVFNLEIDEFRLEYLKRIIDITGAKIVLSSTWRHFFKKENDKVLPTILKGKKLYDMLMRYGIEIYDKIPTTMGSREEQIQSWLLNRDDINNFVIIDDEPNMFKELLDKLIITSKVNNDEMLMNMDDCFGLCEEHITLAVDMLKNKVKIKRQ